MSWFLLDSSFVPNGKGGGDSKKAGDGKKARQTGYGIPAVLFLLCVRASERADCAILGAEDGGREDSGWMGRVGWLGRDWW